MTTNVEFVSAGAGHSAYPHYPGYLYDCPACEAECFCDTDSLSTRCIYCELEDEAMREEQVDE